MAAPHLSSVFEVEKDWIDYNGHMNMAYYTVIFDRAADELFLEMNMGPDYAAERRLTIYTAEIHLSYIRELHQGHRVRVRTQLLDHDTKRLHLYQEIHHEDGWLAAACECLSLHIDMNGPKVTPFPDDIAETIETMQREHADLPHPQRAGRSISIPRR
ncbi:thioesterase family protein [Nitratireductor sp. CH_MIT9313-5]|uniref:thioesterase family protein n=1 Tax=Nitratireductor sp. CH_MIT9313-5 TaxID=3107764 RepID=UPI003008639A